MSSEDKIRAIIVDDSPQARKLLRLMLQELAPDVEICGEAENANDALLLFSKAQPNMVFLDIEMPGKSGIQLLEDLSETETNFSVVFTTAYNDYALKALRLSAVDYLLKPIDERQLLEAIDKVKAKQELLNSKAQLNNLLHNFKSNGNGESVLSIPTQNGNAYVNINDIEYLRADGSYVHVHFTNDKPLVIAKNLKYFESALFDFNQFIRVHRSFLVNIKHVKRFDKSERAKIVMTSGAQIDISRDRRGDFLATMSQFID
jgi:two-component system, LytTR family, response regulator